VENIPKKTNWHSKVRRIPYY